MYHQFVKKKCRTRCNDAFEQFEVYDFLENRRRSVVRELFLNFPMNNESRFILWLESQRNAVIDRLIIKLRYQVRSDVIEWLV